MTERPQLKVVELATSKTECDQRLVDALESLLDDARSGRIHCLFCVAVDEANHNAYSVMHRAVHTTLIGAVSAKLQNIQSDWNATE